MKSPKISHTAFTYRAYAFFGYPAEYLLPKNTLRIIFTETEF